MVEYREYRPSDKNLIYSTFLRGLYYGESWFTLIPKNVFMENYHKALEFILSRDTTRVVVACESDNSDKVLGYSILGDNDVLHWVFVKKPHRGQGIAKGLVPPTTKTVTHLTRTGISLLVKKNLQFNPFAVK